MSPPSDVSVATLREAARVAVQEDGLRAVAREVGLSPMGLRNFIGGRKPRSSTFRKVTAWYLGRAGRASGFGANVARASVAVLLEAVPEGQQTDATGELLAFVEDIYRKIGIPPPGWLPKLKDENDGGAPG